MTEQDKQLLLKDLCARLPYRVLVQSAYSKHPTPLTAGLLNNYSYMEDIYCKPYLRPMSSMTDEEREEFRTLISPEASCAYEDCLEWDAQIIGGGHLQISVGDFSKAMNWLNAHHFDYRGLIPMGLALEAPEGMYKME